MKRRTFLGTVAAGSVAATLGRTTAAASSLSPTPGAPIPDDRLPEATIAELQAEMTAGRLTARRLVEFYTRRIASLDGRGLSCLARCRSSATTSAIRWRMDGRFFSHRIIPVVRTPRPAA